MYLINEALAREHRRERQHQAQRHTLSSELASANRWLFLERRAHEAHQRHLQRAYRAQVSAVAD